MIDKRNIELEKFIQNVEDYWISLRAKDPKTANAKEQANRKMVKKWNTTNIDVDMLLPLLHHDSNEVKLSVAGYLMMNGKEKERSISILRTLIEYDRTGVSPMAKAVLMGYKIPIKDEKEQPNAH